ncbi:MAG TPA: family 10 glycosylhydrolase, partial [Bryobacteraceae bacterium]|nr:family 10 glycosylhydrolase [Bryobacteraceae bacterium]
LVPLSAAEAREESEERRSGRHRRLFAHHDAWSYTFSFRPATADDIRRELEPLRDTDFARIYWESGMGDRMYYPTKLGLTPVDDWFDDPYRTGDRLAAETWRIWRRDGIDPFCTALEYAHQIGLEFHATYRPAGFHFPFPEDEWNRGGFYDRHPELRGRDREGKATPRLSYAYPEVRQKVLEFLREMAQYPVDGICLAYNRRPPFVEYEAPVVDTFRQKYGQDPRKLDARDPRWLKHRAETLTTFMREVRAALADEAARQKRKPFELTAIVMSTEQENLYQAMDLAAWVQAGLVDTLVPYTSVPALKSTGQSWVDPKQAEFFVRLTRGSKTRLALNLMPRVQPPEQFRTRAHGLYQAGAEYLFFWDTNARDDFSPSWSALRRLGHREELAEWARRGSPEFPRPHRKLRKMADWDFRYDTPG